MIETGEALKTIESYIVTINQHMDSIATSAREQSVGLAEVNAAVNQMDQVTQQNAAMVEESNAASATLANEAGRLNQPDLTVQAQYSAAPQCFCRHYRCNSSPGCIAGESTPDGQTGSLESLRLTGHVGLQFVYDGLTNGQVFLANVSTFCFRPPPAILSLLTIARAQNTRAACQATRRIDPFCAIRN